MAGERLGMNESNSFNDKILVVDDDATMRRLLSKILLDEQYDVFVAENGIEAIHIFAQENIELVLTDIRMQESGGIELLKHIKENSPDVEVILITGHGSFDTAKEALHLGAYDYITKPFELSKLLHSVRRALSEQKVRREKEMLLISLTQRDAQLKQTVKELQEKSANLDMMVAYLEASEERYRTLIETATKAGIGIVVLQDEGDQKGMVKYANQGIADLFGYSREELFEKTIQELIYLTNSDSYDEVFKKGENKLLGDRLDSAHQSWAINKEGKKIPIEVSSGVTEFDEKKAIVCYIKDITEKLEAEEQLKNYSQNLEEMVEERTAELKKTLIELQETQSQLIQSEKLASIGQLAAGIAHEINTPTQYVGDNTRFLQESFTDILNLLEQYRTLLETARDGDVPEQMIEEVEDALDEVDIDFLSEEIPLAIEQSLEGIDRVANIVRAMKEFSHPGVTEKAAIEINRAIENTITVAHNEWKYVAEVETDFSPDLPLVPCLPGEFNGVILNIIVNAAHAIADIVEDGSEEKGKITVSTHHDGDWVEIRISDTGMGIPEEIRSKIFDPFFTTKDVGKGTGQGLSISHNVVVEKHGGTINFETETGKGTTFIIRLPIS